VDLFIRRDSVALAASANLVRAGHVCGSDRRDRLPVMIQSIYFIVLVGGFIALAASTAYAAYRLHR
jgi:hypothetical protein